MRWREYADTLQDWLELTRMPVAISYGRPRTDGGSAALAVCNALLTASQGTRMVFSSLIPGCRLGGYYLGMVQSTGEASARAFEESIPVEERQACSIAEAPDTTGWDPAPLGHLGEELLLTPLAEITAAPELILIICNFEQASRLVALDSGEGGVPVRMEMRGPICYRAVTYPLASGQLNVTLMSNAARRSRGYLPDDVLVSAPLERFLRLMNALQRARAAPPCIDEGLRALFQTQCRSFDN